MKKLGSPRIHTFLVTVWADADRRAAVASCSRCFLELHESGFQKVGTSGNYALAQRVCWLCRARRESPGETDAWRTPHRRAGIAELRAALFAP